jgi:O-antigen/teichoic acid export membrane protein
MNESSSGSGDYVRIFSGTAQNVLGIVIAGAATFAANLLMSHVLGREAFGVVTVITQAAFVVSFATRAGMDMAVLRDVAVEAGVGRWDRIKRPVSRAVAIAGGVSVVVAALSVVFADQIRSVFSIDHAMGRHVVEAAALGLPFLALTNVWLSATRGLKIMRYTLYVFWAGQPVMWVVLMVLGWRISETTWMSALAYSVSWILASLAAAYFWLKESSAWDEAPLEPGAMSKLFRYAGPRAPAALFSQLLFWTDLFVLTRYASDAEVGSYSAALRVGQIVVLFLTSVNLMFSPYVADLHSRGETERLDKLFKTLTRWTIAATLPAFILLAVAPQNVLNLFGGGFSDAKGALLILLAGQLFNIATGSVGFVLIMAGRTGWDLLVYAGSLVFDLALALWLCPRYGMEGAAIANAATFAVSNIARLVLVKRFVKIQPYDRDYLRMVPAALACAAAMWAIHQLVGGGNLVALLATGVVGGAVYLLVYGTIGLTAEERRGAAGLLARIKRTPQAR